MIKLSEKFIDYNDYLDWRKEYFTHDHEVLRFGQSFVNKFLPFSGKETSMLFIQKNL